MPRARRSFLPKHLVDAHNLCFVNHDLLLSLLQSSEEARVFTLTIPITDEMDRTALEAGDHVLDWLAQTGRTNEREAVIRGAVLPAMISDFLHFIYEALETSRKAKLNVTYALLRKPLQESLFIFERMLLDREEFIKDLEHDLRRLYSQAAGGPTAHTQRIREALEVIDEADRFNADYLAQLRYDKSAQDGFDGATNQAVHLITTHPAIRTEPLNINFIFSDWESKLSQWDYLYSRLPYLLIYARRLLEHLWTEFVTVDPTYTADVERRVNAAALRWAMAIPAEYKFPALADFMTSTADRLEAQSNADGWTNLTLADLDILARIWGPPSRWQTIKRSARQAVGGMLSRHSDDGRPVK